MIKNHRDFWKIVIIGAAFLISLIALAYVSATSLPQTSVAAAFPGLGEI